MLVRKEVSKDTTFAVGGKAGGSDRYAKKNAPGKHLPDMKQAPNQFTDMDEDERAFQDAQKRRPEQEEQDYTKSGPGAKPPSKCDITQVGGGRHSNASKVDKGY